jgi:hypothetical protein
VEGLVVVLPRWVTSSCSMQRLVVCETKRMKKVGAGW